MSSIIINGGKRLEGSVNVGGAKNAILPILAASILVPENICISGCPQISDVANMVSILRFIGCKVETDNRTIEIDSAMAYGDTMPGDLSKEIRSSIFMMGPMLGRFHKARFTRPGGCEIGMRPINLHIDSLRQMNVKVDEEYGQIVCSADELRGAEINLDYPSVGATENVMMAAVTAKGDTIIRNAAREPEVADLQEMLNSMGGRITGSGSSTIYIEGVRKLHGAAHQVIPDRIVAGTYMVAAAITGGDITVENVTIDHQHAIISKLRESGCDITQKMNSIRVQGNPERKEMQMIETQPYPGFPTDMQAQFLAYSATCRGTSIIIENVFENRFKHASELNKMGANITVKGNMAIVRGVEKLTGAKTHANDLRGGAALVLAALCAEGESTIENAQLIGRGYENLDESLRSLGAEIQEIDRV